MYVQRHVAIHPPKDSILCLPNELLYEIRSQIPRWDIRTHFCFYYTCHHIAALYGDLKKQEGFWRTACHLAGIGMLPKENGDVVSWREIALECVVKDGFCGHPMCGGALLENNAGIVLKIPERYPDWNIEEVKVLRTESDYKISATPPHYIFQYLRFSEDVQVAGTHEDAYLRFGDNKIFRRTLSTHPLACRSFATFPPVQNMTISGIVRDWKTTNPRGVTVWDVQYDIQSSLDMILDAEGTEDANGMGRSLLHVCDWDGLTLGDMREDGPVFDMMYRNMNY